MCVFMYIFIYRMYLSELFSTADCRTVCIYLPTTQTMPLDEWCLNTQIPTDHFQIIIRARFLKQQICLRSGYKIIAPKLSRAGMYSICFYPKLANGQDYLLAKCTLNITIQSHKSLQFSDCMKTWHKAFNSHTDRAPRAQAISHQTWPKFN